MGKRITNWLMLIGQKLGTKKFAKLRAGKVPLISIGADFILILILFNVTNSRPNSNFIIFVSVFVLTVKNLSKRFNTFVSLPLAILLTLAVHLLSLLLIGFMSGPLSLGRITPYVLLFPWVISILAQKKNPTKIVYSFAWKDLTNWIVVIAPSVVAILIFIQSISKFPNGWSFWALGGDARNHLIHTLNTIKYDGVTESLLALGPVFPSAQVALFADYTQKSSKLELYFEAISLLQFFYLVISSVLMAILTKRLLLSNSTKSNFFVFVAGSIPFSGIFSGVSFRDGFISVPILLVVIVSLSLLFLEVWGPNSSNSDKVVIFVLTALLSPVLILLIWTPFVIFALFVAVGTFVGLESKTPKIRVLAASVLIFNLGIGYYCLKPLLSSISGSGQLVAKGSITPPSLFAFLITLLFLTYSLSLRTYKSERLVGQKILTYIYVGLGLVNLFMLKLQPPETIWNYYPSKFGWVWLTSSIPLVIANVILSAKELNVSGLLRESNSAQYFSKALKKYTATLITLVFLYGVHPSVPSPWLHFWFNSFNKGQFGVYSQVLNGWAAPSPQVIQQINLVQEGKRQPVFWKYFPNPSEERLGNFHLVLYTLERDGSGNPMSDKLIGWAYFADTSKSTSLCELIEENPEGFQIITKSDGLLMEIQSECNIPVKELEIVNNLSNGTL